jgi:hypothetical protein
MIVRLPLDADRHRLMVLALASACRQSLDRNDPQEAIQYLALAHDVNYIAPTELPPHSFEDELRKKL